MEFAHAILESLKPGRALDLACGKGQNAMWLAERGWHVTAIDREPAEIHHANIDFRVADLERHEFAIEPRSWDLIVICRYLQRDLYEPAKAGLVPGGVIVASALLPGEKPGRFRIQPGELATYFRDFEILFSGEGLLAEVVARKPDERAP